MRAQLFTALFVLLAVAAPTNAQKRTLAEAQKVAENFFLANDNKTAVSLLRINNKSGRHLLKKAHDEKQAEAFYLFTDEREKQLLIVSGDERMQRILGYTDRPLAGNAIPDGLADLLWAMLPATPLQRPPVRLSIRANACSAQQLGDSGHRSTTSRRSTTPRDAPLRRWLS